MAGQVAALKRVNQCKQMYTIQPTSFKKFAEVVRGPISYENLYVKSQLGKASTVPGESWTIVDIILAKNYSGVQFILNMKCD